MQKSRSIIKCRKYGCIIGVTICPVCKDDNSSYLIKCKKEGVSRLPCISFSPKQQLLKDLWAACKFRTGMSSHITQGRFDL
ncbi:hypothetical protein J4217_02950 [Candidatus Pacearchaeota archaeon]|nr:hypothetical protein [Candidatus Pacearchaeota archaeon]